MLDLNSPSKKGLYMYVAGSIFSMWVIKRGQPRKEKILKPTAKNGFLDPSNNHMV